MLIRVGNKSALQRHRILVVVSFSLALVVLAAALDLWNVSRRFNRAIEAYTASVRATPPIDTVRSDLPPLLRGYVHRFERTGLMHARWVRIEQRGEMRLKPDGAWMPLQAVQHFSVAQPAFIWRAIVRMMPGVDATVIDGLIDGQGILEARLFSAIPVAQATGPDTLKGELQRYLAEMAWNPGALAMNPAIRWAQTGTDRVAGRVELGGVSGQVELRFDAAGDIVESGATDRPRGIGDTTVPTPWHGQFSNYRELNGVRIPTQAVVWWDLPEGRFEYWRGEVTALTWE